MNSQPFSPGDPSPSLPRWRCMDCGKTGEDKGGLFKMCTVHVCPKCYGRAVLSDEKADKGEEVEKITPKGDSNVIPATLSSPSLPPQPSGWISVKERLPETLALVVFYEPMVFEVAKMSKDCDWTGITHWMPLPPIPVPSGTKEEQG